MEIPTGIGSLCNKVARWAQNSVLKRREEKKKEMKFRQYIVFPLRFAFAPPEDLLSRAKV